MKYLMLLFLVGCTTIPLVPGDIEVYFCPECDVFSVAEGKNASCAFYDLDREFDANLVLDKNSTLSRIMHNKFCVWDDHVITGSLNPTDNGIHKNDNNVLFITSRELAQEYKEYFEYLKGGEFTPKGTITINGSLVDAYFCPVEDCMGAVLKELRRARESIRFMSFSFTSKEIGNVLITKSLEGVTVEGVFEKSSVNIYDYLVEFIDVRFDTNPYKMHHKVFIIDNETVITGSANPSNNGFYSNYENILIIKDKEIAQLYIQEFRKL